MILLTVFPKYLTKMACQRDYTEGTIYRYHFLSKNIDQTEPFALGCRHVIA